MRSDVPSSNHFRHDFPVPRRSSYQLLSTILSNVAAAERPLELNPWNQQPTACAHMRSVHLDLAS